MWVGDHELLYVQENRRFISVTVPEIAAGADFSFGPVNELPIDASQYWLGFANRWFDISPDGDRLLLFKAPGESQSMVVMTRWLDAVAAKLPARD